LYAATWTEYVAPEEGDLAVLGTVATGAEVTSVFAAADGGDGGDADFAGIESTILTSLAPLPPAIVGAEGAATVTAWVGAVVSMVGGFAEATDAADDGQRWP